MEQKLNSFIHSFILRTNFVQLSSHSLPFAFRGRSGISKPQQRPWSCRYAGTTTVISADEWDALHIIGFDFIYLDGVSVTNIYLSTSSAPTMSWTWYFMWNFTCMVVLRPSSSAFKTSLYLDFFTMPSTALRPVGRGRKGPNQTATRPQVIGETSFNGKQTWQGTRQILLRSFPPWMKYFVNLPELGMESHQLPASLTVRTPDFTSCLHGDKCVAPVKTLESLWTRHAGDFHTLSQRPWRGTPGASCLCWSSVLCKMAALSPRISPLRRMSLDPPLPPTL